MRGASDVDSNARSGGSAARDMKRICVFCGSSLGGRRSYREAAALLGRTLAERRIGAVLVIDRADQLLGIVSERDIMRSIAANGARTLEMTAGQVMTRTLQVAHLATTVAEAMTMMTIGRFRHLPVMDHDALVGLISIGDVVKARIMEKESEVDSLKTYVAGTG